LAEEISIRRVRQTIVAGFALGGAIHLEPSFRVPAQWKTLLSRRPIFERTQRAYEAGNYNERTALGSEIHSADYAVYWNGRRLSFDSIGLPCLTRSFDTDYVRFKLRPLSKPYEFDFPELMDECSSGLNYDASLDADCWTKL
jgi:hypothetical protein